MAEQRVETVEVTRRRLLAAIRKYRADSGLTQKQLADRLGWSLSKTLRVEQGTNPISPSDVRAWLQLFQESDTERVELLVQWAKEVREDKGLDEYSDIASPAYRVLLGLEPSAQAIYKFEPQVVPGLFQTYEYAQTLSVALGASDVWVERQAKLRVARQERLKGQSRPELNFVISEAALRLQVGGPEIMRDQYRQLIESSREPHISLSILPLAAGAHAGLGSGAFTVMQFDDPDLADLLYLENAGKESTSRDEHGQIERHLVIFRHLRELADKYGPFEEQLAEIRSQLGI